MWLAATRKVISWPATRTRTFCRLGYWRRLEMPVVFLPTPPSRLALPRLWMLLATMGRFPLISHTLDMALLPCPKANL